MPAPLEALPLPISWLSALSSMWICPANELGDVGGFICPWECQHFCHKRTLLCSRWYLAWDIIRDYRPLSPEALTCFCAQTVPIKQNQLWELVSETIGLSFGSLGELLSRRLVSIAKEAQRSVSPAGREMTCSRKPITCSVSFALAKKLLYLSKRDCGPASGDLAALPRCQLAVDLMARSLLQHVPPSRLSGTCGHCSCLSGPHRCVASPQDSINWSLEQESASFPRRRHFSFLPLADQVSWSSRGKRSRGLPGRTDRL